MRRVAFRVVGLMTLGTLLCVVPQLQAQPPEVFPGGFGGRGGPGGGRGGPRRETMKVLEQFDKNKDGLLDKAERPAAREYVKENRPAGRGFGGPGGFGRGGPFGGGDQSEPSPGKQLTPDDVAAYPDRDLYDPDTIRTLFFEFEADDWEQELEDFNATDVEVPARLIVDGKAYENVGLRFRGMSSYFTVGTGRKRSLNVSLDLANKQQHLHGYKTLNLLNSHTDPSFLRTVLFNYIARQYVPSLEANLVRVVINGESWGLYVNEEQFNKDFLRKWFSDEDGFRWKVPPDFSGSAALMNLGDDVAEYKQRYQLKSKDSPEAWKNLAKLCQALETLPDDRLESELDKLIDIDRALWELALENTFIDSDGYISRGSDYLLYQDKTFGRFHLLLCDNNETFRTPSGPGFGGGGIDFDPLSYAKEETRPLMKRLLAVPHLRARYLAHLRTIVQQWLDWEKLGPVFERYRSLIDEEVKADTRKLDSYEAFAESATAEEGFGGGFGGTPVGLKTFVDQRRDYLLNHLEFLFPRPEIKSVEHSPIEAGVRVVATVGGEIAAEKVFLYYATQRHAPFTRVPMSGESAQGNEKAGDAVFEAALVDLPAGGVVRYYVEARSPENIATATFMPATTEAGAYEIPIPASKRGRPDVVINELLAVARPSQNEQEPTRDWIELFNRGDIDADLSGMYLSDSRNNRHKWRFPDGTTIPAGGCLAVWADQDGKSKDGLHASFRLSGKGDELFLSDVDERGNAIIDRVKFGKQTAGVSFGRFPDGDANWQPLAPTRASANRAGE